MTGLVTGLLPVGSEYLKQRLDRAVSVLAMDRLYRAMDRLTGLARMEDPRFRDKLRLAQQTGRSGPGQLVDDGLGAVQAAVTMGGFLGTLLVHQRAVWRRSCCSRRCPRCSRTCG